MNKLLRYLNSLIKNSLFHSPGVAPGEFDSRGGTYDYQTEVQFNKQLFLEVLAKSFFGRLSRSGVMGASEMDSYSINGGIDGSSAVWKQTITQGDEFRLTYEEAIKGMPVHGDIAVPRGNFLQYKNQAFRIGQTKSAAAQVPGEMNRLRVAASIVNMPSSVKKSVIRYMAEELEFDAIIALLMGASKSLLAGKADGGLAISMGPGSGIGSGIMLCGQHWYTTDTGFITYDGSALSIYNSLVNDAINGIDAAAADKITIAQHEKIREKLDDLNFTPVTFGGKQYKALAPADPQIVTRLAKNLLKSDWKDAGPRSYDNKIFGTKHVVELDEILYISVRNYKKFRPSYNGTTSIPDFGPNNTSDPRDYTNSESIGLVTYLGGGALLMGTNGTVETTKAFAPHGPKDGVEVSARQKYGLKRGQWDTYDGRTESTCTSVLTAAFYEPGQDW